MDNFTVCALYTPNFKKILSNLKLDCERLKYNYRFYEIPETDYIEIIKTKPHYWKKAISEYGKVLWLDADARIFKPIPSNWLDKVTLTKYTPHTQTLTFQQKNSDEFFEMTLRYYLGGCAIIDNTLLPIIEKVIEYLDNNWDDEILFNYIVEKYNELMPDYNEVPFYNRWTTGVDELIESENTPHVIRSHVSYFDDMRIGYIPIRENTIIFMDERHHRNLDKARGSQEIPIFWNGHRIYSQLG